MDAAAAGLSGAEAARRLAEHGPNTMRDAGRGWLAILVRQLANPLLALLAATAAVSIVLGEHGDAAIILWIVAMSVGLGFFNEYRSAQAVADVRERVTRRALALRDGRPVRIPASDLVPGDAVVLGQGDIVPADLVLTAATALACDESVLTGEALPVEKAVGDRIFMGTAIRAGTGRGTVVATGVETELGRIARQLERRQPETGFQRGLRDYSTMLVAITGVLAGAVFVLNVVLHRGAFSALLFALAIAVGLTPQLLPAIVTVSLATGARRMARRSAVVKRLVTIEDFGNMEVLMTDKTGTLTEGRIRFLDAVDERGAADANVIRLGLLCGAPAANALDAALQECDAARTVSVQGVECVGELPFDSNRRMMSVVVQDAAGRLLIVKGAPEALLPRCRRVDPGFEELLRARFAAGERLVAVATKRVDDLTAPTERDERELDLAGLLVFADPPKPDAAAALARLRELGIAVKIVTGDNELVAQKVCADLSLPVAGTLTGVQIAAMSAAELRAAVAQTTIFARVGPDQKAAIIRAQRAAGCDVGYLGDGVNDAVALHDADVGISVDDAVDVARDAADVVLLEKDLGVLAEAVAEGRRIFGNTIKYVLMGTSSNFGNMLSTAGGSFFLPFLPMLPSQILLNNVLYDVSEMTIPTDNVDPEQLRRPAHWDMRVIQRFMFVFGPISSLFDFAVFGFMLWAFNAQAALFQAGFFAESFVTQTLVIFAIRTRRVPFFRSRPSRPLVVTTLAVATLGVALPFTPAGALFGFAPLPPTFIAVLAAIVLVYVSLIEVAKRAFYSARAPQAS
jgi:Mg2+-importing ATPase